MLLTPDTALPPPLMPRRRRQPRLITPQPFAAAAAAYAIAALRHYFDLTSRSDEEEREIRRARHMPFHFPPPIFSTFHADIFAIFADYLLSYTPSLIRRFSPYHAATLSFSTAASCFL